MNGMAMGWPMLVLEISTVVIGLIAGVYMIISYKRLVRGELTEIIKWVVYAVILVVIFVILREAVDFAPMRYMIFFHYAAHTTSLVAVLCLLRAAILLDRFSRVYGFAEVEEEFAKLFISKGDKEKEK